ncbi:GGDEF domain-containing protein [Aliiglaciecola sp. LCG003]|uniref:GGDEF domain-containing protein n=1 Tax=Aliiglaciecola sp. LCG003 TaxID=3053655 RepID=UPI0025722EF0|nr:GGDEF domain-containing protein [Aliiglaciecola sp. LCG003]WJG07815.1 GGDEF domain-containing protein [Aliiglaciecola sp. LCG003]
MMRFTLVLCLIIAFNINAQSSKVDVQLLIEEAEQVRSSDFAHFEVIMAEIQQNSSALTPQQKHFYQYLTGYQNTFKGKLEEANAIYNALQESDASEDLKLRALGSLVNNYAVKRDFYLGAKAVNRLFEQREKVTDKDIIDSSFLVVSIFYNQARQFELGLNIANRLLARDISPRIECFARQIKIESEFELSVILSSYDYANQSAEFCMDNNELLVANIIKTHIAESLTNENRVIESQKLLSDNLQKTLDSKYPPLIGMHYALMANNYLLLEQPAKATEYALEAKSHIENFGLTKALVKALDVLYRAAEEQDNYIQTIAYLKEFNESDKAYLDETKARNLAIQQAKYEYSEQLNKIFLLDKQNALLVAKAELAQQHSQNNRMALALSSALLILLFAWLYRSRKIQVKLRYLAETDDLTGISNRHNFNDKAIQQIHHAERHYQPVSFILFDLDHFKRVNDNYGHQIGDWALCKAVSVAKNICRNNDLIGRMGGEEFAILLPSCDIDEALKIADICRQAIEHIDSSETNFEFKITASFGVSDSQTCGYSLEKLFGGADAALYHSKDCGRNKVFQFFGKKMALKPTSGLTPFG